MPSEGTGDYDFVCCAVDSTESPGAPVDVLEIEVLMAAMLGHDSESSLDIEWMANEVTVHAMENSVGETLSEEVVCSALTSFLVPLCPPKWVVGTGPLDPA